MLRLRTVPDAGLVREDARQRDGGVGREGEGRRHDTQGRGLDLHVGNQTEINAPSGYVSVSLIGFPLNAVIQENPLLPIVCSTPE